MTRSVKIVSLLRTGHFGTTSGHLREQKFADFPYKRHQTQHLVFPSAFFASRGAGVRASSRPPTNCVFQGPPAQSCLTRKLGAYQETLDQRASAPRDSGPKCFLISV